MPAPHPDPEVQALCLELNAAAIREMGQEWCDRYGHASLQAALVVSGTISSNDPWLNDREGSDDEQPSG